MKTKIKKHIRKYIAVACSLFLIPLFSISSFAYTSYDNFPCTVSLDFNYEKGTTTGNADYDVSPNANNIYIANNSKLTGVTAFSFASSTGESFYFPVDQNVFNYYLFGSFVGVTDDISNFTYFPDSFFVRTRNHSNGLIPLEISDLSFYHTDSYHCKGFSFSCLVDMDIYNCIDYFIFKSDTAGTLPAKLNFEFSVIALPKSLSSDDAQMAIVSAINAQTSSLGEKLDGIDSGIDKGNDLIENGTDDTQSAITDFNEVFEDFNAELENIEEFDNSIISEFESANEQYLTELNNFSLSGSLLNAGNWLSTSMQTVYDNSSDYKMLWLVPLLLGIPLIILFVRKGSDDE